MDIGVTTPTRSNFRNQALQLLYMGEQTPPGLRGQFDRTENPPALLARLLFALGICHVVSPTRSHRKSASSPRSPPVCPWDLSRRLPHRINKHTPKTMRNKKTIRIFVAIPQILDILPASFRETAT